MSINLEDLREDFDEARAAIAEKISAACAMFDLTDFVDSDDVFALADTVLETQNEIWAGQDDDETDEDRQCVLAQANDVFEVLSADVTEMFSTYADVIEGAVVAEAADAQ
jgi:hypothetical protein